MKQLELPITKEFYKYNLYLNCEIDCCFATDNKKKLEEKMGSIPFGCGWQVKIKDEDGNEIRDRYDEFIPF